MNRVLSILTVLSLAVGFGAGGAFSQAPEDLVGPQDVLVLVSTNNGWGKNMTSALACNGRYRIIGAYSDSTAIRGVASPDSALSFINELLAMNFFDQPEKFKSSRTQLVQVDGGRLAELWEGTMDAGSTKIELHIGEKVHAVVLAHPAHGAPEKLKIWVGRFANYMKELRGW